MTQLGQDMGAKMSRVGFGFRRVSAAAPLANDHWNVPTMALSSLIAGWR